MFIIAWIFILARLVHGSPICYKCSRNEGVDTCDQVHQCTTEQSCFIARVRTGDNATYDSGCLESVYCSDYLLGRRAVLRSSVQVECMACCQGDLCNVRDCMPGTPAQISPSTTPTPTRPRPIDGGWGSWGSWTRCPYTCGKDGIQHRLRTCNNPSSQHGGQPCHGDIFDRKICHTLVCCSSAPNIIYTDNGGRVRQGEYVVLRCNATNYDSLIWTIPKIVGQPYPANVHVPEGTDTVFITGFSQQNTGPYTCIVRNSCGMDFKKLVLELY